MAKMKFTESEGLELSRDLTPDICKDIIAFANTDGGTIYIGVSDNGKVRGIKDMRQTLLQLSQLVRDAIKPDVTMFVQYEVITSEERDVIKVSVQRGTVRPYYLASKGLRPGGVFVRSGVSSALASEKTIRTMLKESDGDNFEAGRALLYDVSFKAMEKEFFKRSVKLDSAAYKSWGIVSEDGAYTNLAMLLSDQCGITTKVSVFSGEDTSVFQERQAFGGSLFKQLDEVYAYVKHIHQKADHYPKEAVREALLNAFMHRDYAYSASTMINIYSDRIEIVTVGGLLPGIQLADVMLGLSISRNPRLAAIFYQLSFVDAPGTGLQNIFHAYSGASKKPEIKVTEHAFRIMLPCFRAVVEEAYVDTVRIVKEVQTDTSDKILAFIRQKKEFSRQELEEYLGVSQATTSRILTQYTRDGYIQKVGRGKRTRYVIIE